MTLVLAVVYSCAICALIGIYKAIANHLKERPGGKRGSRAGEVIQLPRRSEPRLRWINGTEFANLRNSDPNIMAIHLLDDEPTSDELSFFHDEMRFTLPQLEETLPWVPAATMVVLFRPGGIDSALARRLARITYGREVLVLSSPLPQVVRKTAQMAGEVCN